LDSRKARGGEYDCDWDGYLRGSDSVGDRDRGWEEGPAARDCDMDCFSLNAGRAAETLEVSMISEKREKERERSKALSKMEKIRYGQMWLCRLTLVLHWLACGSEHGSFDVRQLLDAIAPTPKNLPMLNGIRMYSPQWFLSFYWALQCT
jgi:hypothetical protein